MPSDELNSTRLAPPAQPGAVANTVVQDKPPEVPPSGHAANALASEIEAHRADGTLADGYELIRKLGTGSFGTVWEARNRLTGERVAIKFFTAGDADWEKLLKEVGLLQTVEGCRGIVLVKEVRPGAAGRRPLYVMQLANGGSLADWTREAAGLPPRERARQATRFFARTARAMAAVHRRGIHHCDLKPQNVLLHHPEPGAAPDPLVADFGQGHLATDDTPALGTFFYMPPDQIEAARAGTPPDTRWDVYALGAIAYELLTGAPPRRTPDLVERVKAAPRTLAARLSVYVDGVTAAPAPTAHHRLVDKSLARIIDRCLSLDPRARPRDAGALVAQLDARSRWRRTRPVLGLAAAASLLVVGLIAGAGAALARAETRRQEEYVVGEVESCLTRTAGYGARAVEDRLQRHVVSLEGYADLLHKEHPAVVDGLVRAGKGAHGPTAPGAVLDERGRTAVTEWLLKVQPARQRRAGGAGLPTLGLMLVTAPDAAGFARGFYAARVHGNNQVETFASTPDPAFFTADLSYRDYFHGGGDRAEEAGLPHKPVRRTHISQPFRSRGADLTADGAKERPWKLNIAAPVWDDPKLPLPRRRVIGLVVLGLDVERDLESLVHPREFDAASDRRPIAKEIKVVLVDHRNQWVWHPDCKNGRLAGDETADRLPHDYRALAGEARRDPEVACPWLRPPPDPGQRRPTYTTAHDYTDLVEARVYPGRDGAAHQEIACFARFDPYRLSDYDKDSPGSREWVFVAQVNRTLALTPLRNLERDLFQVALGTGAALLALAAALWAGLFRTLRRLELASHG